MLKRLLTFAATATLVSLTSLSTPALAFDDPPLTKPKKLNKPTEHPFEEAIYRLPPQTVRVAIKDEEMIKRDFPETRKMTSDEIDQWLVKQAGFISSNQFHKGYFTGANSLVYANYQQPITAYRPEGYGRALVVPTEGGGLLDVKGMGAVNPGPGNHSTGLMPLSEGLQEFAMEHLVSKIFKHAGNGLQTVGTYAVLDAGFDVNSAEPGQRPIYQPASLVLRQAHVRSSLPAAFLPTEKALAVEKTLRTYGVSSTVPSKKGENQKYINIQGSVEGAVIDFGSFWTTYAFQDELILCPEMKSFTYVPTRKKSLEDFSEAILYSASNAYQPEKQKDKSRKNKEVVLHGAEDPDYIKYVDHSRLIPLSIWGSSVEWKPDGTTGRSQTMMAYLYDWAVSFRLKNVGQENVTKLIQGALDAVEDHWQRCQRAQQAGAQGQPPVSDRRERGTDPQGGQGNQDDPSKLGGKSNLGK